MSVQRPRRKATGQSPVAAEAPSDDALLGIASPSAQPTAAASGGDPDFDDAPGEAETLTRQRMNVLDDQTEKKEHQSEPAVVQPTKTAAPKRSTIAPQATAAAVDEAEPQLTRRSRLKTGDNDFEIPAHLKKPGWDYEWKTTRVMAADVDGYELAKVHEQGWRPVSPAQMPGMLAPGSTATTIDRMGQRLYMRPMHLSQEAKREDYQIAETQKLDKLKSASAVPIPGMAGGKMRAQVDSLEIVGEVGSHKPRAA